MKSLSPRLFTDYADKTRKRIGKLDQLKLPRPVKFIIDWKMINQIYVSDHKLKWQALPIYKHLLANKNYPAVYYFIIKQGNNKLLHKLFQENKSYNAEVRINNGVGDKNFKNISHVPKKCIDTDCLYVGSRKQNVQQRLIQHLGFGSGRTGAMNLFSVLGKHRSKFVIEFYCHVLDDVFEEVTTDIEGVIQAHFKPLIGKNILGD